MNRVFMFGCSMRAIVRLKQCVTSTNYKFFIRRMKTQVFSGERDIAMRLKSAKDTANDNVAKNLSLFLLRRLAAFIMIRGMYLCCRGGWWGGVDIETQKMQWIHLHKLLLGNST